MAATTAEEHAGTHRPEPAIRCLAGAEKRLGPSRVQRSVAGAAVRCLESSKAPCLRDWTSVSDSLFLLNLRSFHLYRIAAVGAKEPEKFIHARRLSVRRAAMRTDYRRANFGRQEEAIRGPLPDFTA